MSPRPSFRSVRLLRHAVLCAFAAGILAGGSALLLSATASAAPGNGNGHGADKANHGKAHQVHTSPQPASRADFTGHGANTHGPYNSTRDGSPSGNGNGNGAAVGKPCAGCVGKADNKNPPGQLPGGSDLNSGYECDSNHGVGRTNPAHTGCRPDTPTPPPPPPGGCPSGMPPVNGQCDGGPGGSGGDGSGGQPPQAQPRPAPAAADASHGLASTGSPVLWLIELGGAAIAFGAGLMIAGRFGRRHPSAT